MQALASEQPAEAGHQKAPLRAGCGTVKIAKVTAVEADGDKATIKFRRKVKLNKKTVNNLEERCGVGFTAPRVPSAKGELKLHHTDSGWKVAEGGRVVCLGGGWHARGADRCRSAVG